MGLRELRCAKGLTQEQLAGAAGLSVRSIRDLESGENRRKAGVLLDTARRLATALGVGVQEVSNALG